MSPALARPLLHAAHLVTFALLFATGLLLLLPAVIHCSSAVHTAGVAWPSSYCRCSSLCVPARVASQPLSIHEHCARPGKAVTWR